MCWVFDRGLKVRLFCSPQCLQTFYKRRAFNRSQRIAIMLSMRVCFFCIASQDCIVSMQCGSCSRRFVFNAVRVQGGSCSRQSTESPILDAPFLSENGVSCPHERNKIGDSVLWFKAVRRFTNTKASLNQPTDSNASQ
jgi:hypothetical protein